MVKGIIVSKGSKVSPDTVVVSPLPDDRVKAVPDGSSKGKLGDTAMGDSTKAIVGSAIQDKGQGTRDTAINGDDRGNIGEYLNPQGKQNVKKKRQHLTYSEPLKIRSVTFALMQSNPTSIESLNYARELFNTDRVDASQMSRWITQYKHLVEPQLPIAQTNPEIVTTTIQDVTESLTKVRDLYLAHLMKDSVIEKASAQQAVIVMGTSHDKLAGMLGIGDSEVNALKQIKHYCTKLGYDTDLILRDMVNYLAGLSNQQDIPPMLNTG